MIRYTRRYFRGHDHTQRSDHSTDDNAIFLATFTPEDHVLTIDFDQIGSSTLAGSLFMALYDIEGLILPAPTQTQHFPAIFDSYVIITRWLIGLLYYTSG